MSQPDPGVGELLGRREARKRRQPPEPHHPKPAAVERPPAEPAGDAPASPASTPPREVAREIAPEIVHEITDAPVVAVTSTDAGARAGVVDRVVERAPEAPAREAIGREPDANDGDGDRAGRSRTRRRAVVSSDEPPRRLPNLYVDLSDAAAMMVTPTVLSVPGDIVARFDAARPSAVSHTAVVLDALRAHAITLPDLVMARRPGPPQPGDLFPFRAAPGEGSGARPAPLRIRPTAGEVKIMDRLTEWVHDEVGRSRPGGRRVTRSEIVTAALDAYLPPILPLD